MAHTSHFYESTLAHRVSKGHLGMLVTGRSARIAAIESTEAFGPLQQVLNDSSLYPVFQPIVNLGDATIHAHEALIRGPGGSALHTPDALLRAAAIEGLEFEFEFACVVAALRAWGKMDVPGRLFVNMSATALTQLLTTQGSGELLRQMSALGVLSRMLVLEITEHERVDDMDALADAVAQIRGAPQ